MKVKRIYKDKEQSTLTIDAFKCRQILAIKIAEGMEQLERCCDKVQIDYLTQLAFQEVVVYRDIFGWDNLSKNISELTHGDE